MESKKRYRLIKEYPNSPKLGTIVEWAGNNCLIKNYNYSNGEETYIFIKTTIENYPTFWEEIKEPEFEILAFRSFPSNKIDYFDNQIVGITINNKDKWLETWLVNVKKYNSAEIYQVKRLSDSEIFTIGDTISLMNKNDSDNLNCMEIYNNRLIFNGYCNGIESYKHSKTKLFTTEDGIDIYKGDKLPYWVPIKAGSINLDMYDSLEWEVLDGIHQYDLKLYDKKYWKVFSTKEKAEEYILYNKPCLSYNDIKEFMNKYLSPNSIGLNAKDRNNFKKLVKQKLNL